MCIGCHNIPGYQASFPEIYKVPKIAGQNDKYIVSALTAYRKGERRHPTMRAIAASLSDQDMADLAAFYTHLHRAEAGVMPVSTGASAPAAAEPPASIAKLLATANCVSCHGANFASPIDPSYPKLAGQHADYLYAALKSYQVDHNPLHGPQQRDHDGHGAAVHASRDQGDRRLPQLAAERPADGVAVALQVGARAMPRFLPLVLAAALVAFGATPRRCAGPARAIRRPWTRTRRTRA